MMRQENLRLLHEQNQMKEKIAENAQKIKQNKVLPYLVGNVVEVSRHRILSRLPKSVPFGLLRSSVLIPRLPNHEPPADPGRAGRIDLGTRSRSKHLDVHGAQFEMRRHQDFFPTDRLFADDRVGTRGQAQTERSDRGE